MGRVEPEEDEEQNARTAQPVSGGRRENRRNGGRASSSVKAAAPAPGLRKGKYPDADFIKRGLEQMAASREKNRGGDENWIRDLKPEEVEADRRYSETVSGLRKY